MEIARFNPRARVGRDPLSPPPPLAAGWGFNPRARVGRDRHRRGGFFVPNRNVSIHAPAWGATI